eukprot:5321116-Pyramimonas_sp.AAC.1
MAGSRPRGQAIHIQILATGRRALHGRAYDQDVGQERRQPAAVVRSVGAGQAALTFGRELHRDEVPADFHLLRRHLRPG